MDGNGPLFLERTKLQFLEDLTESFGDRATSFSDELRVLLFEMWVRARSRPPFPVHRPERPDVQKQAEFEEQLVRALHFVLSVPDLKTAFATALGACLDVDGTSIVKTDLGSSVELKTGDTDPLKFAETLNWCLQVGDNLHKWHDDNIGQVTVSQLVAPEVTEAPEDKGDGDSQDTLSQKLEALGVFGPPGWVPVYQEEHTGVRVALDPSDSAKYEAEVVDTLLVRSSTSGAWVFPHPRPLYRLGDYDHIEIWVDGELQTLTTGWDSGPGPDGREVVTEVFIGAALDTSRVRARYPTTERTYGL